MVVLVLGYALVASFYFYLIILNFAVLPCLFLMQNIKYFASFVFCFAFTPSFQFKSKFKC